jgi:hypothetical protein
MKNQRGGKERRKRISNQRDNVSFIHPTNTF